MRRNSKKVVFVLTVGLLLIVLSLSSSAANNSLLENTVAENADSSYNETVPHLEENESYSIPADEIAAINENLKEEGLTVKDITITALPIEKPVINPDEEYDPGSIKVLPLPPRDGTLPLGASKPSTFASAPEYDLELIDITAKEDIAYPFAMKTEKFLLTIANHGSKYAFSTTINIYINDELVSNRVATFPANKTTIVTTGTLNSLPPAGVNKVRVTINEDKKYAESDFSNNSMEKDFEWTELKRVVAKSSAQTSPPPPEKPLVYTDATVEFIIANEGNKDLYNLNYELAGKLALGNIFTDIKTGVIEDLKIGEKYTVTFTFTHSRGIAVEALLNIDPDNVATPIQNSIHYPKRRTKNVYFINNAGGLDITFYLDEAFRSEFIETDPDAMAESIVDKGSVGFKEHFGIVFQTMFANSSKYLPALKCPLPYDEACGNGDCTKTKCPGEVGVSWAVHHKSMFLNLGNINPIYNKGKDEIVHLLTGYEMCSGLSGEHKTNIRGLAYRNGYASISQIKNDDMTRSIRFMQHELSHNLGAEDNNCYVNPVTGITDPCIMTYESETWTDSQMDRDVWCKTCKEKIIGNIPTRTY